MRCYLLILAFFAALTLAAPMRQAPSSGLQAREAFDSLDLSARSLEPFGSDDDLLSRSPSPSFEVSSELIRRMDEAAEIERRNNKCSICLSTIKWPAKMATGCPAGHEQCKVCYAMHVKTSHQSFVLPKCPECREPLMGSAYKERRCGLVESYFKKSK